MNWKIILIGIILIGAGSVEWHIKDGIDELHLRQSLADQLKDLSEQCDKQKKITENANANYQSKISAITSKLNEYRLQSGQCVAVTTDSSDVSSSGRGSARNNGLTVAWLRSFAAKHCATYRAQRIVTDQYFKDSE